jgi:hypothetical protein
VGNECEQMAADQHRSRQRHILEDNILHSHRCENLKSYIDLLRLFYDSSLFVPVVLSLWWAVLYIYIPQFVWALWMLREELANNSQWNLLIAQCNWM